MSSNHPLFTIGYQRLVSQTQTVLGKLNNYLDIKIKEAEAKNERRNYSVSERAIIMIGVMADLPLDDINSILKQEEKRQGVFYKELNPSSYEMLKKKYKPHFLRVADFDDEELEIFSCYAENVFGVIFEHILSPKSMSNLKDNTTLTGL